MSADGDRPPVLLVMAEGARRDALQACLRRPYRVRSAGAVEDALHLAQEAAPELIVLDAELGPSGGLAALQALIRHPKTAQAPVLVVDDGVDDALAVRCLELGASDYLSARVGEAELLARAARSLRESHQRKALAALAHTDALTGLPNFGTLRGQLREEFKRANRYDYPISVVMIDLDHLKAINDRFGHEVGNRAIVALARHLSSNLRETDFAARFGGDEFVVLLPYQTSAEAAVLLERLRAGLEAMRLPTGTGAELRLSFSAGIAGHSTEYPKEGPEHILQASDAALYEAKRLGRNRVTVFEQGLGADHPGLNS